MRHRNRRSRLVYLLVTVALTWIGILGPSSSVLIASSEIEAQLEPALHATDTGAGVRLQWTGSKATSGTSTDSENAPFQLYGGHFLPMRTFAVRYAGGAVPVPVMSALHDVAWVGDLAAADAAEPAVLDWEPAVRPALVVEPLPAEPVFVLRTGRARGQSVAVYAFSEVYKDASGALRRVESGEWTLPEASLLSGSSWPQDAAVLPNASRSGYITNAEPPNVLATQQAIKVYVSRQGIQEIDADALSAAGLAEPSAEHVRLYLRGKEIALQVQDGNQDGRINGADHLRFYAERPGDVWNEEDVYWLVDGHESGKRMSWRGVSPGDAPIRSVAYSSGVWSDNRVYESALFGPDRDNWFHAVVDSGVPDNVVTASLQTPLPLVAGSSLESVFTVNGTAVDMRQDLSDMTPVAHRLRLVGDTISYADGAGDWLIDFGAAPSFDFVHSVRTSGVTHDLEVSMASAPEPTRIYVDEVGWQQPVRLDFDGKGAAFRGVTGDWRYRLANVADGATLYDITDAANPRILGRTDGTEYVFEDGPEARDYLLAGDGTVHGPRLEAHHPIAAAEISDADVVYIAPEAFHAALDPVLQLRQEAGLVAVTVDVQELYAGWGYGFVDPGAIRDFLRTAVGAWRKPPVAAVLVGDGTSDPKDYLGLSNPNHIPPYLADVDPWLRVTPCDNCYAQLDGDDPLSESAFLLDIQIGRLPVATVDELEKVVNKIVRYERDAQSPPTLWRNVSVQLADDWVFVDGTKDGAGNFPGFVESIGQTRPPGIRYSRLYYNADVDHGLLDADTSEWLETIGPWTEPDAPRARRRARSLLDQGAGLVTYTGHANHWLWARLGDDGGYDNRLFGLWDVASLTNRDELFIGLSMTCLTAQFSEPAERHFTLDEHLLLHPNGGAVAVWGPAGLGVAHGHDALQSGFYDRLWSAATSAEYASIGALVHAGYENVALQTACCQDVIRTFVLLGDPLTPARVQPLDAAYLSSAYSAVDHTPLTEKSYLADITAAPRAEP